MLLASGAANVYALGTATPTDIPGVVVVDAHVAASYVNNITVGPAGNPPLRPAPTSSNPDDPSICCHPFLLHPQRPQQSRASRRLDIADCRNAGALSGSTHRSTGTARQSGWHSQQHLRAGSGAGGRDVLEWAGGGDHQFQSGAKSVPIGGLAAAFSTTSGETQVTFPVFRCRSRIMCWRRRWGRPICWAYSPRLMGNALGVGKYLDALSVQAYSDLISSSRRSTSSISAPAGDQKLQQAIGQLGAERHGALGLAGMHQSRLFMDQLSAASAALTQQSRRASRIDSNGNWTWLHVEGARARQSSGCGPYRFCAKHHDAGRWRRDSRPRRLEFRRSGGLLCLPTLNGRALRPATGRWRAAILAATRATVTMPCWRPGQFFLGYSHIETQRKISIPDAGLWPGYSFAVNRSARGSTAALASGIRLDVAHLTPAWQTKLAPFVGFEYQRFDRAQFDETGAGAPTWRSTQKRRMITACVWAYRLNWRLAKPSASIGRSMASS